MRVLVVLGTSAGGVGNHVHDLVGSLTRAGHHVVFEPITLRRERRVTLADLADHCVEPLPEFVHLLDGTRAGAHAVSGATGDMAHQLAQCAQRLHCQLGEALQPHRAPCQR